MRDDLLHARACVDWTVAHFPAFEQRIAAWIGANVHIRIEKTEPPISHSVMVASQKADLPLSFNVECGMYIHAIRSSLDILATALAIRHDAGRPEDAYFPIARSAAAFTAGAYKGHKLVERLPSTEREIIEALKPYKGGNEPLFTLHNLDIMRKHRRLIEVDISPGTMSINGSPAALGMFIPVALLPLRVNEETVIGFLWNGAPDYQIKVAPRIAIVDTDAPSNETLIGPLNEFARLANSIIASFDD